MLKSARRCGAKHISKSKVLKTEGLRALLEAQLSMERVSFVAVLPSLQHVTLLLPVLSLERWNDGVFSDPSV